MRSFVPIVDSDQYFRARVVATLQGAGYRVVQAATAGDAPLLLAQLPAVALTSIGMPNIDRPFQTLPTWR